MLFSESSSDHDFLNDLPTMVISSDYNYSGPIVISQEVRVEGSIYGNSKPVVNGLIIRSPRVVVNGICISGQVIFENPSTLEIYDCEITQPSDMRAHCIKSENDCNLIIEKCHFHDVSLTAIVLGRRSTLTMKDVSFENIHQNGIIGLHDTVINIENSIFKDIDRFSIWLGKSSRTKVAKSSFSNGGRRVIQLAMGAQMDIYDSSLNSCINHGIYLNTASVLNAKDCTFSSCEFTAVTSCMQSSVSLMNCTFSDMAGNSILSDSSKLVVSNCEFSNNRGPMITLMGLVSSAVITKTRFISGNTHAIIAKDGGNTKLEDNTICNINGHGVLFTSFHRGHVKTNVFNHCLHSAICANNGSYILVEKNRCLKCQGLAEGYANSHIFATNNRITQNGGEAFNIHNRGKILVSSNFVLTRNDSNGIFIENEIPTNYPKDTHQNLVNEYNRVTLLDWDQYLSLATHNEIADDSENVLCLCCKQATANMYLSPCGHKIVCENCVATLSHCPLCHIPIKESVKSEFVSQNRQPICMVCQTEPVNTVCLSCGHACQCFKCYSSIKHSSRLCPQCKKVTLSSPCCFKLND